MTDSLNEKAWKHSCRNGTEFTADRCDFRNGIAVLVPVGVTEEQLLQDVSEMIGFHATNIHPQLNGFQGYDCITYVVNRI